jgi:hypothetical protein
MPRTRKNEKEKEEHLEKKECHGEEAGEGEKQEGGRLEARGAGANGKYNVWCMFLLTWGTYVTLVTLL